MFPCWAIYLTLVIRIGNILIALSRDDVSGANTYFCYWELNSVALCYLSSSFIFYFETGSC